MRPRHIALIVARVNRSQRNAYAEARARGSVIACYRALWAGDLDAARAFIRDAADAIAQHRPPRERRPHIVEATAPIDPARFQRKGRREFTYWYDDRLDSPTASFAECTPRSDCSEEYRLAFQHDPRALDAYLASDLYALRAPWVIAQLEAWAADGHAKRCADAVHFWAYRHKNPSLPDLARLIQRDQWIYAMMLRAKRKDRKSYRPFHIKHARDTYQKHTGQRLTREHVKLIWREYERAYSHWKGTRLFLPDSRVAFVYASRARLSRLRQLPGSHPPTR